MRIEPVFLFDLDGTLVDSVYQHVLAWKDALDSEGIELSVWRIHRKIGMSGGLFANTLLRETGRPVTAEQEPTSSSYTGLDRRGRAVARCSRQGPSGSPAQRAAEGLLSPGRRACSVRRAGPRIPTPPTSA